MAAQVEIVVATHNAHKVAELQAILVSKLPEVKLLPYSGPEPVEVGTSFEQNSLLKARAAAAHTGKPAIADDSGISVTVMGGAPGIFSARWSGPAKDAAANNELLLWQLSDIAPPNRSAAFHCAAALVIPEGCGFIEQVVTGVWPGWILPKPQGENGFGYDPIFRPDGFEISAAELTADQKNKLSHRTRAFEELIPIVRTKLLV